MSEPELRVSLVPVVEADFDRLADLRVAAMRESLERVGRFNPERARERLRSTFSPPHTRFILFDGVTVGFYAVRPSPEGLSLDHLYVHPDFQSRGIGGVVLKKLFADADQNATPIKVGALKKSGSNRFYQRYGFEKAGESDWDIYYVRPPSKKEPEANQSLQPTALLGRGRSQTLGKEKMKLRVLTPSDSPAYRDLRLHGLREWPPAFGTPAEEEEQLSLKDFSQRLVETKDRCLVGAFEEDVLVGSVRLSRYDGSNEFHRAYVAGLYVMPERRKLGYGRALLTHVVARARRDGVLRRLNLTVVSEQKSAIALYTSLGFVSYGIEKEVFQARGLFFDEILMTLDLRKEPNQTLESMASSGRGSS